MCYLIGYGTSTMPGDLKFKRMPKNEVCELAIFCLPQQEPRHEAARIPLQDPARKLRQSIHTQVNKQTDTILTVSSCFVVLTTKVQANSTAAVPPIKAASSASWNTSTALA